MVCMGLCGGVLTAPEPTDVIGHFIGLGLCSSELLQFRVILHQGSLDNA